jgi:ketosteroid isomerase-like protein
MSNKVVVEKYMHAYQQFDHKAILDLLTDDVIWEMPGYFHHTGKDAFDKEIEPADVDGPPDIHITRLMEEGNIVVAEGTVQSKFKNGNSINAVFCDVFHFTGNKINKLTSYVMFLKTE